MPTRIFLKITVCNNRSKDNHKRSVLSVTHAVDKKHLFCIFFIVGQLNILQYMLPFVSGSNKTRALRSKAELGICSFAHRSFAQITQDN